MRQLFRYLRGDELGHMRSLRIAILGATGHIAKNLIYELSKIQKFQLVLFARNKSALNFFINSYNIDCKNILISDFDEFYSQPYDAIINCIGVGNPLDLIKQPSLVFSLTEQYDNFVLDYLRNYDRAIYIYLSSGAVYGSDFTTPTSYMSCNELKVNQISSNDYYTISKINAEAKHRAFSQYNIVDLRVFGFFSQFVDLQMPYFMNEIVRCVLEDKVFVTNNNEMIRDYIHPKDMAQIIEKLISKRELNDVFDIYSYAPVSKFEIIDLFAIKYNLAHEIKDEHYNAPTGNKVNYYSINKRLSEIGYTPNFSSLNSVETASELILFKSK